MKTRSINFLPHKKQQSLRKEPFQFKKYALTL